MNRQLDVLLYGLGAIGSFYAFILSQSSSVRLTVCARSNYQAVKDKGFVIKSENHGEHTVIPYKVVRTPDEAETRFDYVICANKAIEQTEVASRLTPVVDETHTTVVIIQNGVGNEDPFRERFPRCTIISCVTWVGATQHTPGIVNHTKNEDTQIGLFPNHGADADKEKQRLATFTDLLTKGKTKFTLFPNIQIQRWEKVIWNCAWNALTTLTMLDTQAWFASSPDAVPLSRRIMKEAIDVARACKVPVEYELIDRLMDKVQGIPGITSSMQKDCQDGKPMEVEIILGVPVKKGRELGVPIPTLETLYIVLQGINYRMMHASA